MSSQGDGYDEFDDDTPIGAPSFPGMLPVPPTPSQHMGGVHDLPVFMGGLPPAHTDSEFLFPEDATRRRKSWGERLTYSTGVVVLAGTVIGTGRGVLEGMRAPDKPTTRLRINAILNACGRNTKVYASGLGILSLYYTSAEALLERVRATDDIANGIAAGGIAGVVYRCTKGPVPMLRAGAVGLAIASAGNVAAAYLW